MIRRASSKTFRGLLQLLGEFLEELGELGSLGCRNELRRLLNALHSLRKRQL